ncbi:MAG: ATP-dependent DNA helicase RecG, partial [Deltaproteobacteria bacterium]
KTAVAAVALRLAADAGYQAAVMAPTELLAEQHARTLEGLLEPAGIEVTLVRGRQRPAARREAADLVARGEAAVVVGTHALLEEAVRFRRLGLVVVDEQHRFGVRQRAALLAKGHRPDLLVMTATPIPRTLAMTAYGDLEVSLLDALPPGRQPVETRVLAPEAIEVAWQAIREAVASGRQAYVVYPLVDASERLEAVAAATEAHRHLDQAVFPDLEVGLLHGRLPAEEKARVMEAFAAARVQVLVATTVVEVGIDVPNATVMVVQHAERFGLAQLHQLRGRVGRGRAPGRCFLVGEAGGGRVAARLAVMEQSSDGFEIAEADLRIRGPGELLGTRQSGLPDLAFGHLVFDRDLLLLARRDARALLERDPELSRPEHRATAEELRRRWQDRLRLGRVG